MARKKASQIDEKNLTKGQLRKLNALRKSLGQEIADRAFVEWLQTQPIDAGVPGDENADVIATTLWGLIEKGNLAIPRGGYVVRRGRGRVVVERAVSA